MSGIGVVTNPRSRHNRRDPDAARSLAYVLGEKGQLVAPDDLDALAHTAEQLRDHEIEVLCVNGGDGTLHQVLTALVRAYGEDGELPPVALLRGGTMNIVADSIGVKLPAAAMLEQVVDAWHGGTPLRQRRVRALRVEVDDLPPTYGFLSGNGIIARFLEVYYEKPDPTPLDAAALLARGSVSALVGGRLIRRLTRPWEGQLVLDGERWAHDQWVAVAIGTIEQMGLGFRVFHLLGQGTDHLQVVGLAGSVSDLARELPTLYRGRGVHRPADRTELGQELILEGPEGQPLMVDGDFYFALGGRVRYTLGPEVAFVLPCATGER